MTVPVAVLQIERADAAVDLDAVAYAEIAEGSGRYEADECLDLAGDQVDDLVWSECS